MARRHKRQHTQPEDQALQSFQGGIARIAYHPLFAPLLDRANVLRRQGNQCPPGAWAIVTSNGDLHVHPTRRGTVEEWTYVLAHCLLHLAFGHFQERRNFPAWNLACDVTVDRFLASLKLGQPPAGYCSPDMGGRTEERLYQYFCERNIPANYHPDMLLEPVRRASWRQPVDWPACFAAGLSAAVTNAVEQAAGISHPPRAASRAQQAREWFINNYPLLGALAVAFDIIEDPRICQSEQVSTAAVDAQRREIFINPGAGLTEEECRFVMAHELLHVGLRHQARRQGRDPLLWNIACDYVINGWLVEMGIGDMPRIGVLYDPALKGASAEAIYDLIVTDLRRCRRLRTLRGVGLGDILERGAADWWQVGEGMDLDTFYRHCLTQGLYYHQCQDRGMLPAALIEEIRALSQPPIPWDVELARWFDEHIPQRELVRSYARPSRRQSSTPAIPRPRYLPPPDGDEGRTFGVVLDTSGSMDRVLLAKALGAIASYAIARDVGAVRVVFCDAATYDQGYLPPEAIADRVQVKGRGGTILQPAIDLLERATDFPKPGPILIITDGWCDNLRVRREHAFLMPEGSWLPFTPRGPVFRMGKE